MKHLNARLCLLSVMLFCGIISFGQKTNPISQQRKKDIVPRQTGNNITSKFNPTLSTQPNTSQGSGITDGADVRVFPSSNVQSEVHISINKNFPYNLLASTNTLVGPFKYNQGFYASFDGGMTWGGSDKLQNIAQGQSFGDPTTAIDTRGNAYMTTIAAGGGYWFQKSTNFGVNWSAGTEQAATETSFDKGMSTVDNQSASPNKNNFYSSWTNFGSGNGSVEFNRSTDGGGTFSSPITLRSGTVGFGQGTNVQTGPNGEVYVCWADHATLTFPYKADHIGFVKSTNAGVSFTPAANIFGYTGIRVGGGDALFNGIRTNDFPAMAVDKSGGPYNGRIYIVYAAQYNDTGKAIILLRYSSDGGATWSNAKTINIRTGRQNFFPWIAVDDSNGDVWIDYYSFDGAPSTFTTNTYVARSTDGGVRWKNQKVSDVTHITAPIDNTNFATGYAGDYIGITAFNGKAYPIWMDDRNGTWQLYCSPVAGAAFAGKSDQDISENKMVLPNTGTDKFGAGPNPFGSTINLNLAGESIRSVMMFSETGKLVKQWSNLTSKTLDVADIPKGFYIIKVTGTSGNSYSEKLIKQ